MKKMILCLSAASLIAAFMPEAYAQDKKNRINKEEEIVIKKKGDKNVKMTVEINDDEVMINGKPLNEFNNQNVTVDKRVRITRDVNDHVIINRNRINRDLLRENERRSNISRERLREGEVRPFLGVTSEASDKGAKITAVSKGSSAEKAGLKEGDIITSTIPYFVSRKLLNTRLSLLQLII